MIGAARDARRLQHRDPMLGAGFSEHALDFGPQRLLVLVPQVVCLEKRVFGEVGPVEGVRQLDEEPVIAGGDDQMCRPRCGTLRTG